MHYPWVGICELRICSKQEKADWEKWLKVRATSLPEAEGGRRHSPVEHVAQSLVPDPRVHRRAGLPGHQVGSVVEKMDVHQVKGAAGTDGRLVTWNRPVSCGVPPGVPLRSPGHVRPGLKGRPSKLQSESTRDQTASPPTSSWTQVLGQRQRELAHDLRKLPRFCTKGGVGRGGKPFTMKVPTCSHDGGQLGKCGTALIEANSV